MHGLYRRSDALFFGWSLLLRSKPAEHRVFTVRDRVCTLRHRATGTSAEGQHSAGSGSTESRGEGVWADYARAARPSSAAAMASVAWSLSREEG